MGFVAPLVGGVLASKAIKKAVTPSSSSTNTTTTAATPAVAAATPEGKQDTGVDTTGESLKRKAKGKKGLMINASNTTGGGSTGGTGLNL